MIDFYKWSIDRLRRCGVPQLAAVRGVARRGGGRPRRLRRDVRGRDPDRDAGVGVRVRGPTTTSICCRVVTAAVVAAAVMQRRGRHGRPAVRS